MIQSYPPLTPNRRRVAEMIRDGQVSYAMPNWIVDGAPATGWTGRTLREMLRDELIETTDEGTVTLTAVGRAALDADE